MSIQVVRTFNRLREYAANHKALANKLALLEKKYDGQFKIVFDALRELMMPVQQPAVVITVYRTSKIGKYWRSS